MIVDEAHQLLQQPRHRTVARKLGDDHQEARIPTRENLQRPHLPGLAALAGDRMPQALALLGTQGLQPEDAEEFEERCACVVQCFEVACGGPQEHDLGIRLE